MLDYREWRFQLANFEWTHAFLTSSMLLAPAHDLDGLGPIERVEGLRRGIGTRTCISPSDTIAARERRGSRGGRPPKLDADLYKSRNVVERSFALAKQWRGLATRYDKLAITYRAAVTLCAIMTWLCATG